MDEKELILSRLADVHKDMYAKLRAAKDASGKSAKKLSEETGIPVHNIERIMQGDAAHPNAFYLAALCVDLGLSLDELLGVKNQTPKSKTTGHFPRGVRVLVIYFMVMCLLMAVSLSVYRGSDNCSWRLTHEM